MPVNIDTVYQKVLTLSNKEQRGYITPQEFNLMADKAQFEIFDSYFHDAKTAYHKPKNDSGYSDELEMLSEKLQPFRSQLANSEFTATGSSATINMASLAIPIHKLDTISITRPKSVNANGSVVYETTEAVELTRKEIVNAQLNPLTKATHSRPTYVREANNILKIYPIPGTDTTISFYYWKRPRVPKWGYIVVNGKALYNFNTSVDFQIHGSEEENLVTRILALSGVIIEDQTLAQTATGDSMNTKREQND
tara:strand:- start:5456 stop:6211 length:756 start_codon:yes stop_codon:yes gene_type:complete